MIIIKRFVKIIIPAILAFIAPTAVSAYNVVNLPEDMMFSDAIGVFDADEIERVTVSDLAEGKYIELLSDEIDVFFDTVENMPVYRTINPTPFRGIAVNIYTGSDVKSYYINSGIQIGMYGSDNYICYQLGKEDIEKILYLDSMYKDDTEKKNGEELHRSIANDFLKLPSAPWAQPFAREAASNSLLPYEFTDKYSENITREQFCKLLGNFIAVKENYASLDMYMTDNDKPYLKNYFADCSGVDDSVNMLHALGIVNGRDGINFDPQGTITREEAATLLCKVAELYGWIGTESSLKYADKGDISPWAVFYVTWANENGIMTGVSDDEFAPQGAYTVEQAVATMIRLNNFLK